MPEHNIIAIGASAGGIGALGQLFAAMPCDLNAAVFLVLHRPAPQWGEGADRLVAVLERFSTLPVCEAEDLQRFRTGTIYVCPGDRHLLVEDGIVRLERSPKETHVRPSIDVLFRSAALSYGRRVIGVVLTGMLYDGVSGLWEIKKRGGVAIAQDPNEAQYSDLPRSAIDNGFVDYVLPLEAIAEKISHLTAQSACRDRGVPIRVLIVEDEALVASNLRAGLKSFGYEVTGLAERGEEALAMAAGTIPDLVLMDIGLPGSMTGVEAARAIWERLQIPVVYLTAYADLETLNQVKTTENYGYVVKPVQLDAVRAALELALTRRQKEERRTAFS